MKNKNAWRAGAAAGALLLCGLAGAADPAALRSLALQDELAGRYVAAEASLRKLVAMQNETDSVADLLLLGRVLKEEGRYREAEPVYLSVVDELGRRYGVDHPDVGEALKNLAEMKHAEGREQEAERLYWRSYMIASYVDGAESSQVGEALFGLALVRRAQNRNGEAKTLLERALRIADLPPRSDHKWDRIDERDLRAMQSQERQHVAYRGWIFTRTVESTSPEMAEHLEARGAILLGLGRLDDAQGSFSRALEMRRKNFGDGHPLAASDEWQLARVAAARHDGAGALELARSAAQVAIGRIGASQDAKYAAGERTRWHGLFVDLLRLRSQEAGSRGATLDDEWFALSQYAREQAGAQPAMTLARAKALLKDGELLLAAAQDGNGAFVSVVAANRAEATYVAGPLWKWKQAAGPARWVGLEELERRARRPE